MNGDRHRLIYELKQMKDLSESYLQQRDLKGVQIGELYQDITKRDQAFGEERRQYNKRESDLEEVKRV